MQTSSQKPLLLVGTYTEKKSHVVGKAEGLYLYEMDTATGALHHLSTVSDIKDPSFVAVHPNGEHVYVASEVSSYGTDGTGLIYAYHLDRNHQKLTLINTVSSEGAAPCYVSVHPSGQFALAANYGTGTVTLMHIREDGGLEVTDTVQHQGRGTTKRQESPHAHMVMASLHQPEHVYVADLGIDQIRHYTLSSDTKDLEVGRGSAQLAPGSGPRHLAFHPTQPWTYVVNELSGSVSALRIANHGALEEFQTVSTLPEPFEGEDAGAADIHITPSGKYLYVSNRGGYDNLAMFAIDPSSGYLSQIGFQSSQGDTPRNFTIDPSGTYLLVANQDSDTVVTFKIDEATGKLVDTGVATRIPTPVCLQFVPG